MRKEFKYLDKTLLFFSVLLFVVGLIMVFSSSNITAYMKQGDSPYTYFIRQFIFLFAGVIASIVLLKIDTKFYKRASFFAVIVTTIILAIILVEGKVKNGASSWVYIGPFSLQPSEFLKAFAIMWMSCYYEFKLKKLDRWQTIIFPFLVLAVGVALIFLQPDLGTLIIYLSGLAVVFFLSPIEHYKKTKLTIGALVVAVLGLSILFSFSGKLLTKEQKNRFDYFNPCSKFLTTGNQVCNGYIAINNGGLLGVGLGKSTQKYLYLPEPYTDFIFAITMEELGLLLSIGILFVMMIVIWRILLIGNRSFSTRGALICYGFATILFMHILVNLGGLFGLIPLTGVPLPFISYGGSFTLMTIGMLSIVQRINVETREKEEKIKKIREKNTL